MVKIIESDFLEQLADAFCYEPRQPDDFTVTDFLQVFKERGENITYRTASDRLKKLIADGKIRRVQVSPKLFVYRKVD